jgi:hypothetical protein
MKKKKDRAYCNKPDRDVPGIMCGYPLPCPWHTVAIHLDKDPPTVEIPATAEPQLQDRRALEELKDIARVLDSWKGGGDE